MPRSKMANFVLVLSLFVLQAFASSLAQPENLDDESSFEKIAEYLSQGSGKWKAENENYDPSNERSPMASGLWFDWVLKKKLLQIRVAVYMKDETYISFRAAGPGIPVKSKLYTIPVDGTGF